MKKSNALKAFTLIELLVVITIIAILAGIALPVYNNVTERGQQTKALAHAKQIALAMKMFAIDNDGVFPRTNVPSAAGTPANSNQAFAALIPDYIPSETIFAVAKSEWSPTTPDNNTKRTFESYTNTGETLEVGENHFAYVMGLNDTSNPSWPLIADGFASGTETDPTYTSNTGEKGGVWAGKKAIVIYADTSGTVENTVTEDDGATYYVPRKGDRTKNAFVQDTDVDNPWLSSSTEVLNPAE